MAQAASELTWVWTSAALGTDCTVESPPAEGAKLASETAPTTAAKVSRGARTHEDGHYVETERLHLSAGWGNFEAGLAIQEGTKRVRLVEKAEKYCAMESVAPILILWLLSLGECFAVVEWDLKAFHVPCPEEV